MYLPKMHERSLAKSMNFFNSKGFKNLTLQSALSSHDLLPVMIDLKNNHILNNFYIKFFISSSGKNMISWL